MRRFASRLAPGLVLGLVACTQEQASETEAAVSGAIEGAVESVVVGMLQIVLVMILIAAVAVVVWALVIGGGVAAITAALNRSRPDRPDGPPPARAGGEETATPMTRRDPIGMGMLAFGIVLLMSAVSTVCSVTLGPTTAGQVTIPLPMIIVGVVLVVASTKRSRPTHPAPPPQRAHDEPSRR